MSELLVKKRTKSHSQLVKSLDDIFSLFVRLRDADKSGVCSCITCGAMHHWKKMHAGHFIGRQHMATRWVEENVNAQCVKCNTFNEGEKYKYGLALQKKFKKQTPEILEWKAKGLYKPLSSELEAFIYYYEREVETLKRLKKL